MDLFKYAFENDISLLQSNLDFIGVKDPRGKSLLHYAVLGSAHDVVDYLLSQDMDVNITDQLGETALFDCARKGKLLLAKKLIEKYARVDIENSRNETVLHLACHKGNLDMVKLLMESGANPMAKTTEDRLPIHYAILAGHEHLIHYLMEVSKLSWFYLDDASNTFLHYAARTTNESLIDLFLNQNLDPNALNDHFETPLFNAAKYGTKDTVMKLLKADCFIDIVNRRFETPIVLAKMNDHQDIARFLEEWKLSPTYIKLVESQSLTLAVLNRDYNKLRALLEQGYRLKKDHLKLTALDYANKYKLSVCINLLRPYA
ncbi:ankyrin repeat domain-containing protein [Acholeplasma equirhinis]|uniref:ankyrin repeat domain-containing protein n=1 Tax=Acholeplasma equirhinis TaxID=555393 RepID=UPI00197AA9F9|nr:ankyrin repeat domain-containing protein [Acholeplasma equirhinis]MBN3490558.1 ankyrin repeat domain-containing protein [Acholeplasma equirhinis]